MARSLEKKAAAVADLLAGELSWTEVCKRHSVSKSTLSEWVREARGAVAIDVEPDRTPAQATLPPLQDRANNRRQRLTELLCDTLEKSLTMLGNWADIAGDRAFIETHPNTAHELGKSVLERADTLVSFVGQGEND